MLFFNNTKIIKTLDILKNKLNYLKKKKLIMYSCRQTVDSMEFSPLATNSLTKLGLYLAKKSVNKAEIARKTGLSEARLSLLSSKESTKLRADEIYLIALALEVEANEILKFIFPDLRLKT